MPYDYYDFRYIYNNPGTGQFYAGGNAGPTEEAVANQKLQFAAYSQYRAIYGVEPTVDQYNTAAAVFLSAGNLASGIDFLVQKKTAADREAADAKAEAWAKANPNPTISAGSPPYIPVSSASPVPGDGASGLDMSVTESSYQPSYVAPLGGVPAPATISTVKTNKNFLIFAALALGGIFILWKRI